MKVLMFGWEFPPHISGGLGTACFGLTSSLSRENIDVLFVIPRLHGEEFAENTSFINASAVPISSRHNLEELLASSSVERAVRHELFNILKQENRLQKIEVPSSLSPYRSPEFSEAFGIERWNYAVGETKETYSPASATGRQTPGRPAEEQAMAPYTFSGAYGADLLQEVQRYAQVAAVIAAQVEFDVIHAHDWMTYLAGMAAKKVSGKPLVLHVHATEYDRAGEHAHPTVRAIEYQGMAEADSVVTVSHWTKKITASRYKVPPEKITVVHNGIIPKKTPRPGMFQPPPIGSHIVTFLGRVTHQKGPLFFVEAARQVLGMIPDVHFVVAGSGDLLPLMIERIAQLRLSSHFHFTGFLKEPDIEKVWSMSSLYVMPSVSEPFGIAPLEAIQAGVPVIISNQSGVAEVMPHAIKVDFWDSRELAAAICSVLKYKSLANTLARNGAEEIGGITWQAAAKKLTNLYYGLTAQQRCA